MRLRKYFIAGLLFWIPIWATYVVIRFLVRVLDETLKLLPKDYQPDILIGYHIPGIGVLFTFAIVFITGLMVSNIIGARLLNIWERILSRLPLVRSLHTAVKQLLHTITSPKGESFRKVVMIEFPRTGAWGIGFQTSESLQNMPHGEESIAVFIPTTPNPTSGFLMIVPRTQVTELNMSIEEAFKLIISVGVVIPDRDLKKYAAQETNAP